MQELTEKRATTREPLEIPLRFDHGEGLTRDANMFGVYFKTKERFDVGQDLDFFFDLEYAIPDRDFHLDCHGQVVRVEKKGKKYGIAVKIESIA